MDIAAIDTLSAEEWAAIFRNGFIQNHRQLKNNEALTYSDFGPLTGMLDEAAKIDPRQLINPVTTIRDLYRNLSDAGKMAYRKGLIKVIESLSPPPATETEVLIQPVTELVYRGDHLSDAVTALAQHIRGNPAWRNDRASYNAIFQIAYSYHKYPEGVCLGEAIMGPTDDRSPHIRESHMHRVMTEAIAAAKVPSGAGQSSPSRP